MTDGFEECEPDLLVPGDLITEMKTTRNPFPGARVQAVIATTPTWVKLDMDDDGRQCRGWLVDRVDDDSVYGRFVQMDGSLSPVEVELMSLTWPVLLRVRPWDMPEAEKAIDRGMWPGTCGKCGRGTYTGANVVEHEPPGCSA